MSCVLCAALAISYTFLVLLTPPSLPHRPSPSLRGPQGAELFRPPPTLSDGDWQSLLCRMTLVCLCSVYPQFVWSIRQYAAKPTLLLRYTCVQCQSHNETVCVAVLRLIIGLNVEVMGLKSCHYFIKQFNNSNYRNNHTVCQSQTLSSRNVSK